MDFYGINMKGPFYGERVSTLPVWTSIDEGREVYCLDTNKRYYGNSTGWVEIPDIINASVKTTPVDNDYIPIIDSEDNNTLKKIRVSTITVDYDIFISSSVPTGGDGENNDIWIQYT